MPTSANEEGVAANRGPIKMAADVWSFLVVIICRSWKSTLSDQILVNVTDSQSFWFTVKIFSWFALAWAGGGGSKYFFPGSLNRLSAALIPTVCLQVTLHCNQDFIPYCLEPMSRYKKAISHDVLSVRLLVTPCHFHFWQTLNDAGLWFHHSSHSAHTEARACKFIRSKSL